MGKVEPVPEGLHTVTPGITVRGAAEALAFYKQAFGAEELRRFATPRRNNHAFGDADW